MDPVPPGTQGGVTSGIDDVQATATEAAGDASAANVSARFRPATAPSKPFIIALLLGIVRDVFRHFFDKAVEESLVIDPIDPAPVGAAGD